MERALLLLPEMRHHHSERPTTCERTGQIGRKGIKSDSPMWGEVVLLSARLQRLLAVVGLIGRKSRKELSQRLQLEKLVTGRHCSLSQLVCLSKTVSRDLNITD